MLRTKDMSNESYLERNLRLALTQIIRVSE